MIQEPSKEILKTVPLFAELNDQELEAIYSVTRQKTYPKGSVIFLEGDPGDALYLILNGEVKVMILGVDGREFILTFLRAGDFFGEMSLLDDRPRSATVMTTEDSTFLVLQKQEFLNQIKESSTILFKFLIALCNRLRETDEKIGNLALLDVYTRISKTLLTLGKNVGVPGEQGEIIIPKRPTHQDFASMVGASRETVTRVLNDLERRGYISLSGRSVVIRKSLLDHLVNI
ncbi:MAG: Crp/Fnr family transcriptional regulator [Nitrospinota bacterium]|nr:MAG: Crp/Fnr family transcriptional regulator [Nitrospinota bacterium]